MNNVLCAFMGGSLSAQYNRKLALNVLVVHVVKESRSNFLEGASLFNIIVDIMFQLAIQLV